MAQSLQLLVIDGSVDWYAKMKGLKTKGGIPIKVECALWKDLATEGDSETPGRAKVFLHKSKDPWPWSPQKEDREITVDFLLVRNFPKDLHENNFRNMVMAFLFAEVPSLNSCESVLRCMDRPLVHRELLRLARRLPGFPTPVPMKLYPNLTASAYRLNDFVEEKDFPLVVKVSAVDAGFGKMIARKREDLLDISSVLALYKDYYTIEPFVPHQYEFRIQKIGSHYRSFRKNSSTSWKNNRGNIVFEDHPWRPEYATWVEAIAGMFGGLDILGVDILHSEDGTDWILEVNDTAPGFMFEHEDEDNQRCIDLVVQRMSALFDK